MDKETWCTRYLSEESPECLPLPDGRKISVFLEEEPT